MSGIFGGGECLAFLDPGQHLQQVGLRDLVDRPFGKGRQYVLAEDPLDLLERALAPRLQDEAAVRKPLIEDALEQQICSQALDQDLLLPTLERVDSLCNQGAGGFASTARLFQADLRVLAQRNAFCLPDQ